MNAEGATRAAILASAPVAALVGTRVYPMMLPQGPAFPAIVYQRISTVPDMLVDGPGFAPIRMQLSMWATTFDGARTLADAVVTALHGYHGGELRLSRLINLLDDYEPDTKLFRVIADFRVHHTQGVAA
jgi:hypothetical protein